MYESDFILVINCEINCKNCCGLMLLFRNYDNILSHAFFSKFWS